MKIILEREYWPTSTHGSLFINDKFICHTIEAAKIPGSPKISCLPEGSYFLLREEEMPFLALKKSLKGDFESILCPQGLVRVEMPQIIIPFQFIKSEGQGSHSQKAFKKVMQTLAIANSAQDSLRLEIRSCPDKALNLACCEIAWME
jgi:hypothetical protein